MLKSIGGALSFTLSVATLAGPVVDPVVFVSNVKAEKISDVLIVGLTNWPPKAKFSDKYIPLSTLLAAN